MNVYEIIKKENILFYCDNNPIIYACFLYAKSFYPNLNEVLKEDGFLAMHLLSAYDDVVFNYDIVTANYGSIKISIKCDSNNHLYSYINNQTFPLTSEDKDLIYSIALSYILDTNYKSEVRL